MYKIIENNLIFENATSKQYEILKNLLENGLAELKDDNSFSVPILNIYELDKYEMEILEFPTLYPYEILVDSTGNMASPDFKYKIFYKTFAPLGNTLPLQKQEGPFITLNLDSNVSNTYLLTQEQFTFINAVQEFNTIPSADKNKIFNELKFAEIKDTSKASGIILDSFLQSKNVVVPKKVKIHIENSKIQPSFNGLSTEESEKFQKTFDTTEEIPNSYPISVNGNKTMVITQDDNLKKELEKIKTNNQSPEKLKDIIEHPEAYFDPDVCDYSELYSDRVVGLGYYTPKIYPFVSPYKSQWIPSFIIEDSPSNGSTKLVFKTQNSLDEFKEAIQTAKEKGDSVLAFKGANLPISQAEDIAKKAQDTFDHPPSPSNPPKKELILLIEDNMEEVKYDRSLGRLTLPKGATLQENPNLKKDIKLKEHQKVGVAWLQYCTTRASGVLLADDMGLGKTLQILYFIDWHYRTNNPDNKPYLVVAPVSLLENWEREYKKFFENNMSVDVIEHAPSPDDEKFLYHHSKRKHLMLMSYECMRRGQLTLGKIDFAMIVLDEAQKIKEPCTMVTNAAKALKADFKIAMTGTPVENTFMNLWCIMDFSVPGYLGNAKEFSETYQKPLKNPNTNITLLGEQLHNALGGYFLRRIKEDVAKELPPKTIVSKEIQMPQKQLETYLAALESQNNNQNPLKRILTLRKISDHPYLDSLKWEEFSAAELVQSSAKLIATIEIIEEIKIKREKVIVFTDRKDMQRILCKVFREKYNLDVSIINGETSSTAKGNKLSRQKTIDRFQEKEGFNIIVMSPLAAGVGLNVVGANHVIHYSRHWNPAKENQATDRAYRIGQTKAVSVYYPMAISNSFKTFDIVLDNLLSQKMNLATSSLYPTDLIEVNVAEMDKELSSAPNKGFVDKHFSLEEIDTIEDYLFEAMVAVLFEKLGYESYATPKNGDKGVDAIAINATESFAIQCKHCKGNVGNKAIQEVISGADYFTKKVRTNYMSKVVTNGSFTNEARETASTCNVELIDGIKLREIFCKTDILWSEIYKADLNRRMF